MHARLRHCLLLVVGAVALNAIPRVLHAQGLAPQIRVVGNVSELSCERTIGPGGTDTLYVVVVDDGLGPNVAAAEFSVTGLPHEDTAIVIPSPDLAVVLGDPLAGGTSVAFGACATQRVTRLFTIVVTRSLLPRPNTTLRVQARVPPSNAAFDCPWTEDCNDYVFDPQCSEETTFVLDYQPVVLPGSNPTPPDGATGVPLTVELGWDWAWMPPSPCGAVVPQELLYLGTTPDPPLFSGVDHTCTLQHSACRIVTLQPETTYYWKVFLSDAGFSPTWHFTTGGPVAARQVSWQHVKRLYR